MSTPVPEEWLSMTGFSDPQEMLIDFACFLYAKERLSAAQARKFAGIGRLAFQQELAKRKIELHYSAADVAIDVTSANRVFNNAF